MKFLANIDLGKNQLLQAVIEVLATAPGTPSEGQIYYNSADQKAYIRGSGSWIPLGGITDGDKGDVTVSGSGTTLTIDAGAITTAKIADDAVTYAKIQNIVSANTILGSLSADGVVTELTKAQVLTLLNVADGAEVNVDTNIAQGTRTSTTVPITSSTGTDATLTAATISLAGVMTAADKTKLDGIEALADVTDATNVNAAGAVMESDISGTPSGRIIDDNTMGTASQTTLATSASIKAYVDGIVSGGMIYRGGYNASTNTPLLDSTPIATAIGDTYTVTAAGTFFSEDVQIGDVLICEAVNATTLAEWTIVNKNIPDIVDSSDTAKGIIEIATNAEVATGSATDKAMVPSNLASITKVGTLTTGNATAIVSAASESLAGKVELATQTEVNTGSDTSRVVTPATLQTKLNATKYSANIGNGSATSFAIAAATHGLGTSGDFTVQVRNATTGEVVITDITSHPSTGLVTIDFNVAPTTNQYRVVIKV